MTPAFSIIIPVYNVAPYLRECLNSVLEQTFSDWEAICVDDGSTDGSGAILDEYAAKDARIKALHAENRGVSAARNSGIDAASGEYVTFLDGDDVYDRSWLEEFHKLINETGAELVRQRVTFWYGGVCKTLSSDDRSHRVCFSGSQVADWGYPTYSLEGWAWLNAIKRSCLNGAAAVRFPVGVKFMEDIFFMLNVLPHVRSACQGEFTGYLYRQRSASACGEVVTIPMVERLFDEMAQLSASLPAEKRKCLSWTRGRVILFWRKLRSRNEAGGEARVRGCVISAKRKSMFRISEFPWIWRPGFVVMLYLHSFLLIDSLLCLQQAWGQARRIIRIAADGE